MRIEWEVCLMQLFLCAVDAGNPTALFRPRRIGGNGEGEAHCCMPAQWEAPSEYHGCPASGALPEARSYALFSTPSSGPFDADFWFVIIICIIFSHFRILCFCIAYQVRNIKWSGNFSEGVLCEKSQSLWHTHETQGPVAQASRTSMPQFFTAFPFWLSSAGGQKSDFHKTI